MTTPKQHYLVAPVSKTGFGFDEIMRNPDYGRFMSWYTQFSYLAAGRRAAKPAAVTATELDAAA